MTTASVTWVGGALHVDLPSGALLVEAPPGVERALDEAGLLTGLRYVVLGSDRMRSLGGLLGLCAALGEARGRSTLHLVHPLDCQRVGVVADAWQRGWPDGVRLDVDAVVPGVPVELGRDAEVTLVPLALFEPVGEVVRPVAGGGLRVELDGAVIAWAPAGRPGTAARRLCEGADLAVIEVGRRPGPETRPPWRPGLAEAAEIAVGARRFWLVGDDGHRLDAGGEN